MTISERWESLSKDAQSSIKTLHKISQSIVDHLDVLASIKAGMTDADDISIIDRAIAGANQQLSNAELQMQELWGFEQDPNKHTWWLKPKSCRCPKLDNTDPAFFGGGRIISGDCPIHNLTKGER